MDQAPRLPEGNDDIAVRVEDGALRLTLTRPERLNALTGSMVQVLCEAIEGAVARDDVRCVVLTGSGTRSAPGRTWRGSRPTSGSTSGPSTRRTGWCARSRTSTSPSSPR